MLRAADKIEYRQQRPAATGQHTEFVAVLGQYRLAGVDHIQPRVRCQQLAQYLGLLLETLARLTAFEKPRHPRGAIQAFAGVVEAFQVVEQGDGIFKPRRVVELQQGLAVYR